MNKAARRRWSLLEGVPSFLITQRSPSSKLRESRRDSAACETPWVAGESLDALTPEERGEFAARAGDLVRDVVYPAYARLSATLEGLKEQTGGDAGVWRLGEEGDAFYQLALNSYGADGMTGDEIHELGLSEVARIQGEMDAIFKGMGMTEGSVADRFVALGARPDMVYPNTDEGRAALLAELNEQIKELMAKAPQWFGAIPQQSVEVRRIPVYEQDSAPGGYYTGPSLDGTRPGIYWINLKDTADWPKHTLKTLTFHEAVPGHHFQISLQRAIDDADERSRLGAGAWIRRRQHIGQEQTDFFGPSRIGLRRIALALYFSGRRRIAHKTNRQRNEQQRAEHTRRDVAAEESLTPVEKTRCAGLDGPVIEEIL